MIENIKLFKINIITRSTNPSKAPKKPGDHHTTLLFLGGVCHEVKKIVPKTTKIGWCFHIFFKMTIYYDSVFLMIIPDSVGFSCVEILDQNFHKNNEKKTFNTQ